MSVLPKKRCHIWDENKLHDIRPWTEKECPECDLIRDCKQVAVNQAIDDCQEALNKKIEEVCEVGEIKQWLQGYVHLGNGCAFVEGCHENEELAQAISKHIKEGMK